MFPRSSYRGKQDKFPGKPRALELLLSRGDSREPEPEKTKIPGSRRRGGRRRADKEVEPITLKLVFELLPISKSFHSST